MGLKVYRDDDGEVRGRYLSAERQPIISDVLTTYEEYDSWAGFSWDQLEETRSRCTYQLRIIA